MAIRVTNFYDEFNGYAGKKIKDRYEKSFKRMEKYVYKKLMQMLEELNIEMEGVKYEVEIRPEVIIKQEINETLEN